MISIRVFWLAGYGAMSVSEKTSGCVRFSPIDIGKKSHRSAKQLQVV